MFGRNSSTPISFEWLDNIENDHIIIINKITLMAWDDIANKLYDGRRTVFRLHEEVYFLWQK